MGWAEGSASLGKLPGQSRQGRLSLGSVYVSEPVPSAYPVSVCLPHGV